jgi:beta-phosphoglucomutase
MKLAIFDLDGTLFDTRKVNYYAYKDALDFYDYKLDKDYFMSICNGKHYAEFLPKLIDGGLSHKFLEKIHNLKKENYVLHLDKVRSNDHLLKMISLLRSEYKIALVTTAYLKNTK